MEEYIREPIERRIKRMESTATIFDQKFKIKSEQDEARFLEISRRIDEFERKLRLLEEKNNHFSLEVTEKLTSVDKQTGGLGCLPEVKREIENIRYGICLDDGATLLESDMNNKMLSVCETIEEVVRNNIEKEAEISSLKEEIELMKVEENEMVEKLRKYIEAMINVYETRNEDADEEMFLNLIS